jgi:hypothetical protein
MVLFKFSKKSVSRCLKSVLDMKNLRIKEVNSLYIIQLVNEKCLFLTPECLHIIKKNETHITGQKINKSPLCAMPSVFRLQDNEETLLLWCNEVKEWDQTT